MYSIITSILTIIITGIMQMSTVGATAVTPEDAASEFMEGLRAGEDTVVTKYVENDYVNLLENTGDQETTDRLYEGLFGAFAYEITGSATKNDVAVVKLVVSNRDFSKVREDYDEAAYKYISSNLYDENVTDKKKLSKQCLDIYLDTIGEASEKGKVREKTIFLPMKSNGYYGWEVLIDDDIMQDILGGLRIPE